MVAKVGRGTCWGSECSRLGCEGSGGAYRLGGPPRGNHSCSEL
jgi:hypothetical protein